MEGEDSNAERAAAKPVSFSTADGKKVEFKAKPKPRPKKKSVVETPVEPPSEPPSPEPDEAPDYYGLCDSA